MKPTLFPLLASLPFLASCGKEAPPRAAAPAAAPVAVQTLAVAPRTWPEVYEATGTVRARAISTVASKVMGYVQQVNFKLGDRVRAGDLLVSVDARDLETSVQRAEAARAEVQSAIPEADSAVAAAKANLDLAQATYKRMDELATKKSISNQEFDESTARLKAAQANYEMARARRTQLDSKMAQVEQEIRAAGITRDYARITAPFAGIVTAKSVEPGNLASPGVPLATIEQEGAYRLEASVEESRGSSIRPGQAVRVSLEALDRQIDARVTDIVPSVDASSRSYTVKIDLPGLPQLRSGMFGRAAFALGSRTALVVPSAAVQERGQLASVFVAENGIARTRLVTLGARKDTGVEVLSGLAGGDEIVAPVPAGLADGAKLEVRK